MTGRAHLSSLQLDELALGAMAQGDAAAAREHLASCAACQAASDAAALSRAHFTAAILPKTMGAIRRRAGDRPRPARRWLAGLLVASGAAAALLFAVRRPAVEEILLAKGSGPSLAAFYQRGGRAAPVLEGEPLRPGDAVRLAVTPGTRRFVAVLSIDGSGQVTRWFPLGKDSSVELPAGARTELPGSIVLDTSPGPERLFAFFTSAPLLLAPLEARLSELGRGGPAALRAARPLAVDGAEQATLRIEKAPQ